MINDICSSIIIIILIIIYSCSVRADVPNDYTSLQEAIDAASNGEVINVAPGIYTGENNKNLDFSGKNIQLLCTSESAQCTIDCENNGRGFYFHSNEDETSIISGFTIIGGNVSKKGGGILCVSSSPTITNCIISENTARWDYGGNGGGIACINSSPKIYNTEITYNDAYYNGSGIFCKGNSYPIIDGCIIANNKRAMYGGGISAQENGNLTILNSLIYNNSAQFSGGGLSCTSSPIIRNSTISHNSAKNGGGIASFFSAPLIDSCIISSNSAENGGGIAAQALSRISIINSSISNNSASNKGSGISLYPSAKPEITACTIWATNENNVIDVDLSEENITLTNTGLAIVSSSSIQGGYTGSQNTTLDYVDIRGIIDNYSTVNPTLSLRGGGLTAYRFKLDNEDVYSNEMVISTPIELTMLSEGNHTLYIIGKDQLGNWQEESEAMVFQWEVTTQIDLILNFTLDVDANQNIDALTDGLLILRYLFGLKGGASLVENAVDVEYGNRITSESIYSYLSTNKEYLDIDSNGKSDALTDGIMIIRYIMGLNDCLSLMNNSFDPEGNRIDCESVKGYLDSLGF